MTEPKNLRVVLPGHLKERFDDLLRRKRISQQDAVEGMVQLLVAVDDDLIQSAMMGQISMSPQTLAELLRRAAEIAPLPAAHEGGLVSGQQARSDKSSGPKGGRR